MYNIEAIYHIETKSELEMYVSWYNAVQHAWSPEFSTQHHMNQTWWGTPSSLQLQEGGKRIRGSKSSSATQQVWDPADIHKTLSQKENKDANFQEYKI